MTGFLGGPGGKGALLAFRERWTLHNQRLRNRIADRITEISTVYGAIAGGNFARVSQPFIMKYLKVYQNQATT